MTLQAYESSREASFLNRLIHVPDHLILGGIQVESRSSGSHDGSYLWAYCLLYQNSRLG
jgi:hypothetical protein